VLEEELKPLFVINAEEFWQMDLFCITTMLDLMQMQDPLKQFENWNLSFYTTQHLITILPDHSKKHQVDANMQTV
jgi:hypothetical protein